MAPLGLVGQIYVLSSAIGSIYLAIGIALGQAHGLGHAGAPGLAHGSGLGHGLGHGAVGQAGSLGHGVGQGAIGQGGMSHGAAAAHAPGISQAPSGTGVAHGGAAAHGTSLHGAQGQGSAAGESSGQTSSHPIIHAHLPSAAADQSSLTQIVTPARVSVLRFILSTLSPFSLSVFLAFFGIAGLFIYFLAPALGFWTMPPAAVIAFVITRQVLFALSWMVAKMRVSSDAKAEDIIGQIATVCVSITKGHTGEVTYVVGKSLYNSPAKASDSTCEFKNGSKVIVCQLRDNVAYVQALDQAQQDLLLPPTPP